ncbi:MAG: hypothetical protein PT120_25000 [Aphanizomenon gracile PMC649.10]|nr:hypothetical protein [Aphanizomenon gracile PMC649.10]
MNKVLYRLSPFLIALSVGFTGIVFAEWVANQIGHTYNPFNQVEERQ